MDITNELEYYKKYLKYKKKYFNLAKQYGGNPDINFFFDFDYTLIPFHSKGYPMIREKKIIHDSDPNAEPIIRIIPSTLEKLIEGNEGRALVDFLLTLLQNKNNVYIITRGVVIQVAMTLAYLFGQQGYTVQKTFKTSNPEPLNPDDKRPTYTQAIIFNTNIDIDTYINSLKGYEQYASNLCVLRIKKEEEDHYIRIYGAISGDEVLGSHTQLCQRMSKITKSSNSDCNNPDADTVWAVIKFLFIKYIIGEKSFKNAYFFDDTQENIDYFNRKHKSDNQNFKGIGLRELRIGDKHQFVKLLRTHVLSLINRQSSIRPSSSFRGTNSVTPSSSLVRNDADLEAKYREELTELKKQLTDNTYGDTGFVRLVKRKTELENKIEELESMRVTPRPRPPPAASASAPASATSTRAPASAPASASALKRNPTLEKESLPLEVTQLKEQNYSHIAFFENYSKIRAAFDWFNHRQIRKTDFPDDWRKLQILYNTVLRDKAIDENKLQEQNLLKDTNKKLYDSFGYNLKQFNEQYRRLAESSDNDRYSLLADLWSYIKNNIIRNNPGNLNREQIEGFKKLMEQINNNDPTSKSVTTSRPPPLVEPAPVTARTPSPVESASPLKRKVTLRLPPEVERLRKDKYSYVLFHNDYTDIAKAYNWFNANPTKKDEFPDDWRKLQALYTQSLEEEDKLRKRQEKIEEKIEEEKKLRLKYYKIYGNPNPYLSFMMEINDIYNSKQDTRSKYFQLEILEKFLGEKRIYSSLIGTIQNAKSELASSLASPAPAPASAPTPTPVAPAPSRPLARANTLPASARAQVIAKSPAKTTPAPARAQVTATSAAKTTPAPARAPATATATTLLRPPPPPPARAPAPAPASPTTQLEELPISMQKLEENNVINYDPSFELYIKSAMRWFRQNSERQKTHSESYSRLQKILNTKQ